MKFTPLLIEIELCRINDMQEQFTTVKKRKQVVAEVKKSSSDFAARGEEGIYERYTWLDSDMDGSRISTFTNSFKEVLPTGQNIRQYVEKVLAERIRDAIGVEFGGVGSKLFGSFTKDFFKKTASVSLVDYRSKADIDFDKKRGHSVIVGDIMTDEVYGSLQDFLGGQKADFIIERMAKGLEFIPVEPYAVSQVLQRWYSMLHEGGIMFVQVPVELNPIFHAWVEMINNQYDGSGIEMKYSVGLADPRPPHSTVRICRLPGAPTELPVLSPREVRKILKSSKNNVET